MTQSSMEAGRWALASAEGDVQLDVSTTASDVDEISEESQDTAWTLTRFHDRFGSQRVPGRVIISAEALEFRPRDRENTVPLALRVGQVTSIESISTLFNKGMRVRLATGEVITFRGRSALDLVESLQSAAGVARATAA